MISFRDYLDVIIRRWLIVTAVLALSVISAIIYFFSVTPFYTSTARFEFVAKLEAARFSGSRHRHFWTKLHNESQTWIFKSKPIAEAVVTRMNLLGKERAESEIQTLVFRRSWRKKISELIKGESLTGVSNDKNAQQLDIMVDSLSRAIDVKREPGAEGGSSASSIFNASISSTSPELANHVLSVYIQTYIEKNLERIRKTALLREQWLREEGAKVENKLLEAQAKLHDFSAERVLDVETEAPFVSVMEVLNHKIEALIRDEESKHKALALQESQSTALSSSTNEANISYINRLKADLARQEAEYAKMRGVYSPTYPSMVLLRRKTDFLRNRISEIDRDLAHGDAETAKKMEKLSSLSVEDSKRALIRVKGIEKEYLILKEEVDTLSDLLTKITKESQEMAIEAGTRTSNIFIIDPPSLPRSPSWPQKKIVLGIGLLFGLFSGLLCAFIRESLDDNLQHSDDIARSLDERRLGVIPDLSKIRTIGKNDLAEGVIEFMSYYHPNSLISDSIRNVEMSVLLSDQKNEIQCFSISSSLPSEGKTFIAVSLAAVLCLRGDKDVVVVDLDMRKPRIHSVFGLPCLTPGMSDVLSGNDVANQLTKVTRSHEIPGLHYITAGPVPSNPVGLLHSPEFKQALTHLRETFDYIVFDCPPILGFADTPIISRNTDGLVIVARQGFVSKRELGRALGEIRTMEGANVLGVVFNRFHMPDIYGNLHKYGYRYGRNYNHRSDKHYGVT